MAMQLNNTVYRGGQGVPLVLVHAFPVDHHMWDDCAAEIIRRTEPPESPESSEPPESSERTQPFPIWAPDMPGAGVGPIPSPADTGAVAEDGAYVEALDRMADAYVELLHASGYAKAVWAGLSMGGYVILDIQRRHPGAVAGFALCDTKGDADDPTQRANRLRIADICERERTVDPVMHFADANEHDSSFKQSAHGKALFARWIRDQRPEGVAWRQRMAAGRPDLNDQLPLIGVPAAVICGDKDPSSPPAVMKPIADAMTGTTVAYTEIADCGHFSAVEHPDIVAGALIDLMRRV